MASVGEFRSYDDGAMVGRPPTREAPAFGKKLAELRKARGLTQAELANHLGITQQTIVVYERRTANPSLELIGRLANFFDVAPASLIDENTVPQPRRHKS